MLTAQGYATVHFGKWRLNGLRGLGLPILADDSYGSGQAGFQTWVSSTNYFEDHPMLSRNGAPTVFTGDSSEVITQEAIEFMADAAAGQEPFFAAIWFGAPHTPWVSVYSDSPEVIAANPSDQSRRKHHGEIVGIDNSVGAVRAFLNDASLDENTIIRFLSDNGSVEQNGAAGTGGLRGHKSTLWEGGIRVPSVVE